MEQQGEDYQWYTHRIPQTDNQVTKRKNISLFTRSNQVTDQRTGNTRQSIDNDGKQGRNASYNIRHRQFRFPQTLDSQEEQKPNGYTHKELKHAPHRDRKDFFQYSYIYTPM